MRSSPRSSAGGRVLHATDGVAVGEFEQVCVALWRRDASAARFAAQRSCLADVVGRHPTGAGFLCIIEATSKPPDDRLRKASLEMILSHGTQLKCVAVVIEAEGFKAALTRSVLTGMALLLPRRVPALAAERTDRALEWMHEHLRIEAPERMRGFVETLRGLLVPYAENDA